MPRSPASPARRCSTRRRTGSSPARASARRSSGRRSTRRRSGRSPRRACARAWCSTTAAGARSGRVRTSTPGPAAEAAELVESGAAEEIYARAGDWVAITAPARLRWIARNRPEVFAGVAPHGDAGRLAGDPPLRRVRDRRCRWARARACSTSPRRTWSETILDLVGLDAAQVPPVLESGTVIGEVTAAAAAETGIPAGTPVVAGGADTQLGAARDRRSAPTARRRGRRVVLAAHDGARPPADRPEGAPADAVPRRSGHVDDRGHRLLLGPHDALVPRRLLRRRRRAGAERSMDVYDLLAERAAGVPPGSNGVLGIFSNVMHASRWIHASPASSSSTSRPRSGRARTQCFRAIQEAAAYVSRGHRGILEEIAGAVLDEIVFTGGASHGAMWAQILADVHGVPVRVPVVKESTLSARRCAGLGAGIYGSLEDADRLVRFERTVEPNPDAVRLRGSLPDGSRRTSACSSWQPMGSCARCGARPAPDDGPEGHDMPEADTQGEQGLPPRRPGVDRRLLPEGRRRLRLGHAEPAGADLPARDGPDGDARLRPRLLPGADDRARAGRRRRSRRSRRSPTR